MISKKTQKQIKYSRMLEAKENKHYNEFTDHDHLKGTLAFDAILGNHMGPRTNNSVITYLHQLTGGVNGKNGSHSMVSDGTGSFAKSLEEAAKKAAEAVANQSHL